MPLKAPSSKTEDIVTPRRVAVLTIVGAPFVFIFNEGPFDEQVVCITLGLFAVKTRPTLWRRTSVRERGIAGLLT